MRFTDTTFGLSPEFLEFLFPVGHIVASDNPANPATYWGFGTWQRVAIGKFLVGVDPGDSDFDVAGDSGGAKTVALTESQIPAHTHTVSDPGHTHLTQRYPTATGASSGFTNDTSMSGTPADNTLPTKVAATGITLQTTGGGQAHNNLPPFEAHYFWKRTA